MFHKTPILNLYPHLIPVLLYYLILLPLATATCPIRPPIYLPLATHNLTFPSLPQIQSWGALISLSPPSGGAQHPLIAVPSTVTNSTFLTTSLLCSPDILKAQNQTNPQCLSRRGGVLTIDATSNVPVDLPPTSPSVLKSLNPGWEGIMSGTSQPPFPAAVEATVNLHGSDEVLMVSGLIQSGNDHTASHLGLGNASVLLSSLVASNRISSRSFGLDAGSQSYLSPRSGSLVLGGYDDGARTGSEWSFPLSGYPGVNGRRVCPLQVTIESMILTDGSGGTEGDVVLVPPADDLQACLEPYDNLFRVPDTLRRNLEDGFRAMTGYEGAPIRYSTAVTTNTTKVGRELREMYVPEPGLIYPFLANSTGKFNGSLRVTLKDGFTVEIPTEELYGPLQGIAKNGTRVVNRDYTELAIYQDEAPEDAAVLGKVFLSRVYLFVDYDRDKFTLSLSNSAAESRSILVGSGDGDCAAGGEGGGWSSVMKGFVALVAILGSALVTLLVFCLLERRRLLPWQKRAETVEVAEDGYASRRPSDDPQFYTDELGLRRTSSAAVAPNMAGPNPEEGRVETRMSPVQPSTQPIFASIVHRQRHPSLDTHLTEYHSEHHLDRIDSAAREVPGTSARDHPLSPDGRPSELGGQEFSRAELSDIRTDRVDSNDSSVGNPIHPSYSGASGQPLVASDPASNWARLGSRYQRTETGGSRLNDERRGG